MLNLDRTDWQKVRFGNVVRNVNESVKDPARAGINRTLGLEHLDPGELRVKRWGEIKPETTFTRRVRPGQTLFGKRRAYQRKTAYADFDAVCSGDILVFESADPNELLPELLPFIATTDTFYARALETSAGSLSPRTRWSDIAEYEFQLPPLDQQMRIANLLWSLESHAASLERCQSNLKGYIDAVTTSFFGTRRADVSRPLSDLCENITVGVVVRPTQYYADAGVPALRSLNVRPGGFTLDDLVYFSPAAHARLPKSTLRLGDVAIVRTGRPGEAAVVDESVAGSNAIDLIIARPGAELNPEFLARFLNSSAGKSAVLKGSAGTAQQHFNVGALAKLAMPEMPLDEQDSFVRDMHQLDEVSHSVDVELEALHDLKASLLRDFLEDVT